MTIGQILIMIGVAMLGYYLGQWIFNLILSSNYDPIFDPIDEDKMCSMHSWTETLVVSKDEALDLLNESKDSQDEIIKNMKKERVCEKCGFLPKRDVMLSKKYLKLLKFQLSMQKNKDKINKEIKKIEDEIEIMEDRFFKEACEKWEALKDKPNHTQTIKLGMAAQKKAYKSKLDEEEK